MKRPKKEKGSVRLDAVPMLPERIWQEIGSYSGQKWALPKNRTPLENLIGIEETNNLYGMTNSAEQNIHLHDLLFAKLRDENEQVRDASIEWIVTDWGGIISDSDTHKGWYKELKTYSELEVAAFIKKYYDDRVASWSKVLAFADSQNYAIYDARVAMSLNVILDKVGYKDRFYMFGTRIKNYEEVFSHMRQHVHTKYIESPRVLRRLHTLRRWSHEQEIEPFFTRSARTRCPHGARAPWRVPIPLGHH